MRSFEKLPQILLLLCFVAINFASPLLRHEIRAIATGDTVLDKRQITHDGSVEGINAFGIEPRLEIRDLERNTDQWNLFILGMRRFQAADQDDMLSYYQVAGIHGRPFDAWNDVSGDNAAGFCHHFMNVFLPWHRAYLALFEQTVFKHIVDAVNEFPRGQERLRYASAALRWRFPYWDWAMEAPDGESVFPASMSSPTLDVTMPNGTNTIHNPLYSYRFHSVDKEKFHYMPFREWNETKRFPDSWDEDANSQNDRLGPMLDNNRVSASDRLYNLFSNYNNFSQFGNEAWQFSPGVSNADSLESVHDVIHNLIGSRGSMTYSDFSAFDPAFFLHHAMVDRLFAFWQKLYPDSYVEPMAAYQQTYTTDRGEMVDSDSALEPFSDNTGTFWTATSLRTTRRFGYTYPELGRNTNTSTLKAAINRLYGNSAGTSTFARPHIVQPLRPRTVPAAARNLAAELPQSKLRPGPPRQYIAAIRSQKSALASSYAVYLFLGEPSPKPEDWPNCPNLVGTHAVFAPMSAPSDEDLTQVRMQTRRLDPALRVRGSMPLTSMLLAKVLAGELESMDEKAVKEYLSRELRWRVGMFDGTDVAVENVADLSIVVASAKVAPAETEDEFPRWDEFEEMTEITSGKPGGC